MTSPALKALLLTLFYLSGSLAIALGTPPPLIRPPSSLPYEEALHAGRIDDALALVTNADNRDRQAPLRSSSPDPHSHERLHGRLDDVLSLM